MASTNNNPQSLMISITTTLEPATQDSHGIKIVLNTDDSPETPLVDVLADLGLLNDYESDLNRITSKDLQSMTVELTAKAEEEESKHGAIIKRIASYEKARNILEPYIARYGLASDHRDKHKRRFKSVAKKLGKVFNEDPEALLHAWDVLLDADGPGPRVVLRLPGHSRVEMYGELALAKARSCRDLGSVVFKKAINRQGVTKGGESTKLKTGGEPTGPDVGATNLEKPVNHSTESSSFKTCRVFYYRRRGGPDNLPGMKATDEEGRALINEWVPVHNRLLYQDRPAAERKALLYREALYLLKTSGSTVIEELAGIDRTSEVLDILRKAKAAVTAGEF